MDPVVDRQPQIIKRQSTLKVLYGHQQSEYRSKQQKRKKRDEVIDEVGDAFEDVEGDCVLDCCCCLCGLFMEAIASGDLWLVLFIAIKIQFIYTIE